MICNNCGTKNENDAVHCKKCEKNLINKEKKSIFDRIDSLSNTIKKLLFILLFIAIVVAGIYFGLRYVYGPRKTVENYMNAIIDKDYDKIVDYALGDEDLTFIDKKEVEKEIKENIEEQEEIRNYDITKIKYKDNELRAIAKVSVIYANDKTDDIEIELINRGSRNVFKNKWKIISDNLIDINLEKNYNVAVPKGSSITVDGIKVDKKYLLKDNNKYKGLDLYELPVILSGTHKLSLVINKEIVTKKIDTEKLIKLNDIIQITKDDLSDESIEELNKRVEESLTSIMNDLTQTEQIVITNDYSKYVDEKHLQEIFEDKREDLLKDNKELTNFKITNTLLSNVSVDKKGIVLRYLFTYEYETDKKHVFANYIKVYLDSDLKIIDINRLP
ncbi:MAG: DUF4878 domain-containing protein [Bacilli bacterium]|nr:DUF4878 domain-containing protein [Bacilli bacterium]